MEMLTLHPLLQVLLACYVMANGVRAIILGVEGYSISGVTLLDVVIALILLPATLLVGLYSLIMLIAERLDKIVLLK